jgi:hypothetical protein
MTSDNDLRRAAHINARSCTCHPDDAPVPCQRGCALSVCKSRAALREKVAKAMLAKPLNENCEPVPWVDATDEARDAYLIEADAAIAVCLEEAAKVAETSFVAWPMDGAEQRHHCAAAIRAMKGSYTPDAKRG